MDTSTLADDLAASFDRALAETPLPWTLGDVAELVIARLRAGGISEIMIRNTLVTPKLSLAQIRASI